MFGIKHSQVEVLGNHLRGQVFYIKGGHGGPDPGAMAKIDDKIYCEDEYANDIALRLGRKLIQYGAIVHFIVYDPDDGIRDDEYLPCDKDELHAGKRDIQVNQIQRLRTRVQIINDYYESYRKKGVKNQKFISIHIDSRNESLELDTHFITRKGQRSVRKWQSIPRLSLKRNLVNWEAENTPVPLKLEIFMWSNIQGRHAFCRGWKYSECQ